MKEKRVLNAEAINLRRDLGIDSHSPIDVFAVLGRDDELTTVWYPMGQRISGLCIKDEGIRLIGINSAMSLGRQRFTAAHELYHLHYHGSLMSVCAKDPQADQDWREKEADFFASFFLAPFEALSACVAEKHRRHGQSWYPSDVVRIEQFFGLSRQAILFRLIDDGYMSQEEAQPLRTGIVASAQRLGVDTRLYLPTSEADQYRTLGRYITAAEELRSKGMISVGKYEELLLDAFRSDIVFGVYSSEDGFYD